MRMRAANWHDYFAVELCDEGAEMARSRSPDGRFQLSVDSGRQIVGAAIAENVGSRNHGKLYYGGPENAGTNWRIRRDGQRLEGYPRFGLIELKLEWHATGFVSEPLPADHLLPWPKLRDGKGYDVVAVAVEELDWRLRSANKAKAEGNRAKHFWEPMPDHLKTRLPSGVYAVTLKRATSLAKL